MFMDLEASSQTVGYDTWNQYFGTVMGMIGLELIILQLWTVVLPRAYRENAGNLEFKISVETEAWNISLPLL